MGCSYRIRKVKRNVAMFISVITYKLVMLTALVSAQRGQTIHLLNIHNVSATDSFFSFTIPELTKTSKPGDTAKVIKLMAFTPDIRICVYDCLNEGIY